MHPAEFPDAHSERRNGDRLIGIAGPLAQELYEAGTPPVHGLAKKPAPSPHVATVKIGNRLRVERVGDRWMVSNGGEVLGNLRWLPSEDGKRHAVTGKLIQLPSVGTLHVEPC
jgi:hypothetical protein